MSWKLGGTAKVCGFSGAFSEHLWNPCSSVAMIGGYPFRRAPKVRAGLVYQAGSLYSPEKFREKDASF
jgi:hypothetical protein